MSRSAIRRSNVRSRWQVAETISHLATSAKIRSVPARPIIRWQESPLASAQGTSRRISRKWAWARQETRQRAERNPGLQAPGSAVGSADVSSEPLSWQGAPGTAFLRWAPGCPFGSSALLDRPRQGARVWSRGVGGAARSAVADSLAGTSWPGKSAMGWSRPTGAAGSWPTAGTRVLGRSRTATESLVLRMRSGAGTWPWCLELRLRPRARQATETWLATRARSTAWPRGTTRARGTRT